MKSQHEDVPVPPGTHLWVVDQLAGEAATVEVDGATAMTIPAWVLPQGIGEGDVLRVKHDRRADRSILMIVTDDEERRRRVARSAQQVSAPSPKDTPGDIRL